MTSEWSQFARGKSRRALIEPLEGRQLFAATLWVDSAAPTGGNGSAGAPFKTIQSAANVVNAGDIVNVLPGTYNEKVIVSRSGAAGAPIVFQAPSGDVTVTHSSVAMWNGLIDIRASYIKFDGIDVRDSTWFGYVIGGTSTSNRAREITVANAKTLRTYATGIYARYAAQAYILNNKIQDACISPNATDNASECITLGEVDGFEVAGNEIWNSQSNNGPSNGGEGIDAKGSSKNGIIRDNYIHNLSDIGIYIDAGSKQGTGAVDDNPMTNITVTRNIIHNTAAGVAVASELGGTAQNISITNNLIYDNLSYGITVPGWVANGPRHNILIANNTVTRNGYGNTSTTWGGGIDVHTINYTNIRILNNVVSHNESWQIGRTTITGEPIGQLTVAGNISFGTALSYWYPLVGSPGLNQDPKFVDAAANDFRLQVGSPAINFGVSSEAPAIDRTGNVRTGLPDAGAYEYQNVAPTITTPASATPSPVTGTTASLGIIASDDAGENNLTYTWSVLAKPSGTADPTFSINGTNAAKSSTATFSRSGIYTLRVTIVDGNGASTLSEVDVTVNPTLTSLTVLPETATINVGATCLFSATGLDQFGQSMALGAITWSLVSGVGSVNPVSGLYAAPETAGSAVVKASSGAISGTSTVTILQTTPNAPTGFAVKSITSSKVNFAWIDQSSNESGFVIDRATNSTFTLNVVSTNIAANVFSGSVAGLEAGRTYYFRLRAINSAGSSAPTATLVAVTRFARVLNSDSDIGSPGIAGSSSFDTVTGQYAVNGSGTDIWGTSDKFHFTYTTATGDRAIVAQVNSVSSTNSWAKAGIMFRDSKAANARFAYVVATPGSGVSFATRTSTGGTASATTVAGIKAPLWVKLVRVGNNFTAYYSTTSNIPVEADWKTIGSARAINMASTALAGLAVTSHNDRALNASFFTNVQLGAVPAAAGHLIVQPAGQAAQLRWVSNSTSESGFFVDWSTDNVSWSIVGNTGMGSGAGSLLEYTSPTFLGQKYFRVRAYNAIGAAVPSNIASLII